MLESPKLERCPHCYGFFSFDADICPRCKKKSSQSDRIGIPNQPFQVSTPSNRPDPKFRPPRSGLNKAIGWGALIGFCCESAYQSWVLYQHYHTIAPVIVFWLPVAIFLGLAIDAAFKSRFVTFLVPCIFLAVYVGKSGPTLLRSYDHFISALAPTFSALLVSGAIGSTLGVGLVGGLFGAWLLCRREHLSTLADASPDSIRRLRALTIVLLITFGVLTFAYLKWTRHWPLAVEIHERNNPANRPRE